MRISLTALTGQGRTDIVINGDSDMTVASVARSLNATLGADSALAEVVRHPRAHWIGGPPVETKQPLWMDGRMLDPQARAARVLKDGALVTIDAGSAPATVTSEPTGPAEIRVAGGAAARAPPPRGPGAPTAAHSP